MERYLTLSGMITILSIVLLALYWLHTFVILYHFIRFGVGTRPKQAALFYFVGSSILFLVFIVLVMAFFFSTQ